MNKKVFLILVMLLSILLSSCDQPKEDHEDMEMSDIYTAAVMTVSAVAYSNQPADTPEPPATTPAKISSATLSKTGTSTATAVTADKKIVYCDDAVFVADVSIPSGKTFSAGEGFTKTWRVKNIGSCTWSQAYALVNTGGNVMGGEPAYMPYGIVPGDTIDLSVWMQAPAENGSYTGAWKIQNSGGNTFGQQLRVSIVVADPTITSTPTVTATNDDSWTNTPVPTAAYTATQVPTAIVDTNTPVPVVVDTDTPVPVVVDTDTPVPTEVPAEEESGDDSTPPEGESSGG